MTEETMNLRKPVASFAEASSEAMWSCSSLLTPASTILVLATTLAVASASAYCAPQTDAAASEISVADAVVFEARRAYLYPQETSDLYACRFISSAFDDWACAAKLATIKSKQVEIVFFTLTPISRAAS